jgi:hypothetical protein
MAGSRSLCSLANELLLNIASQLDANSDLISFFLTCRQLHNLLEPLLYGRDALITTGISGVKLAQALSNDANRPRGEAMKVLDLRVHYHYREDAEKLTPAIDRMPNLKELSIESPYANYRYWADGHTDDWEVLFQSYISLFRRASIPGKQPVLSNLQKCTYL